MEIFHPSIFLAMFPYLFIGSFPVFGLILVTKWIVNDAKKHRLVKNLGIEMKFNSIVNQERTLNLSI
jgi:hypothetical protein